MAKQSAGILLYRHKPSLEVLLVYPGGPFFRGKDEKGNWSIPKGEFLEDEEPLQAAIREMAEETGYEASGDFIALTPIKQKSGKIVYCYAIKGDLDPANIVSNEFEMEWPPRSGKKGHFPEVGKASWFSLPAAKKLINEQQVALLEELGNNV